MMRLLVFLFCLFFSSTSVDLRHLTESCSAQVVEVIPEHLEFDDVVDSGDTYDTMLEVINSARSSLELTLFTWTLNSMKQRAQTPEGEKVLHLMLAIVEASKRKVKVRIVVDHGYETDTEYLQIQKINFTRLIGQGIVHTKLLLVDNRDFYVGSANVNSHALFHNRELGVIVRDCPVLAKDLGKIFETLWHLKGDDSHVPGGYPSEVATSYNEHSPVNLMLNREPYSVYFSASPKQFCPRGRTDDLDSLLHVINNAQEFLYIEVTCYAPVFLFENPVIFWPTIDDAIRRAAIDRGVHVKLLGGLRYKTPRSMGLYFKSLSSLSKVHPGGGSIEARLFVFPEFKINGVVNVNAGVNHNKFMVSDQSAYIGNSNLSGDYFVGTSGIAMTITRSDNRTSSLYGTVKAAFERDWNSKYAHSIYSV